MTNVRTIHVDWYSQRPPRFHGGPQLAYQGDHLSNMVVFDNAPELPNYYLLVEMKTDDAGPIVALPDILLEGPYWVIPNYYTQICQQITYQVCCKTETGDYEHHSAKFKGTILPVLKHNGEPIDLSPMFDPYIAILDDRVDKLIVAAGDIQIDSELKSNSGNPVQNRVIKAAIDEIGEDVSGIDGRVEHLEEGGLNIKDEVIETDINAWLDEHPEATTTVQDGAITEVKLASALKLKIIKDYVTPEMFGAVGDGIEDDTSALQTAINYAVQNSVLLRADKRYAISDTIVIMCDANITGVIVYTATTGEAVKIGDGTNLLRKKIYLNVSAGTVPNAATGVLITNIKNCEIEFGYIYGFYNGVVVKADSEGTGYNKFKINYIYRYKFGLTLINANNGWVNENVFYGGRLAPYTTYESNRVGILITSETGVTQTNSANKFYAPCLETNDIAIQIDNGTKNIFYDARVENVSKCFIGGELAYDNIVYILGGALYLSSSIEMYRSNLVLDYDTRYLQNCECIADTGRIYGNCAGTAVGSLNYSSVKGAYLYRTDGLRPYIRSATVNDYKFQLGTNSILGFLVDTHSNKSFVLRSLYESGKQLAQVVIQLDENDDVITSDAPTNQNPNYGFTLKTAIGDMNCQFYGTSANTRKDTHVCVCESCVKAFIGIRATGSVILERLALYAPLYNSGAYETDNEATLPNMPISTGKVGQYVRSSNPSASCVGWIYYGNAWHEVASTVTSE